MSEELKPCPFCGSAECTQMPDIEENISWLTGQKIYNVKCTNCGAKGSDQWLERSKAIEEWNTRAEPDYKAIAEEMAGALGFYAIMDIYPHNIVVETVVEQDNGRKARRVLTKWNAMRNDNEEDAAKAYNKKALELHGEFARLNIIKEQNDVED